MDQNQPHIDVSNPLNPENDIWAKCYTKTDLDPDNICTLSRSYLNIRTKGRDHLFPVEIIRSFTTAKRKLLLPLVVGGVMAPLALLAIYGNLYSSNILLLFLLTGLFLFYIGINGSPVFLIKTSSGDNIVFLRTLSQNVQKFVQFSDTLIRYFNQSKGEKLRMYAKKDYATGSEIKLYGQSEINMDAPVSYIEIDPVLLNTPINVVYHNGKSHFTVTEINDTAITGLIDPV